MWHVHCYSNGLSPFRFNIYIAIDLDRFKTFAFFFQHKTHPCWSFSDEKCTPPKFTAVLCQRRSVVEFAKFLSLVRPQFMTKRSLNEDCRLVQRMTKERFFFFKNAKIDLKICPLYRQKKKTF